MKKHHTSTPSTFNTGTQYQVPSSGEWLTVVAVDKLRSGSFRIWSEGERGQAVKQILSGTAVRVVA